MAKQKIPAYPELVDSQSSTHHLNSELGIEEPEPEVDMMAGIRSDFVCTTEKTQMGHY